MSGNIDATQEIVLLMQQAMIASGAGEKEKALELLEKAIQIGNNTGADITQARLQRETLLANGTKDLSGLIAVMEESLSLYRRQDNLVEQINTLINLIGGLYHADRSDRATHYIDQVEKLIGSLTPQQVGTMNRQFPAGSSLTAETFLELRLAEVKRLRKVVAP